MWTVADAGIQRWWRSYYEAIASAGLVQLGTVQAPASVGLLVDQITLSWYEDYKAYLEIRDSTGNRVFRGYAPTLRHVVEFAPPGGFWLAPGEKLTIWGKNYGAATQYFYSSVFARMVEQGYESRVPITGRVRG